VASVLIVLVVSVIILGTVVGNMLVVVAVFTSRALRPPQNLFLVSLASADILVATLVIPFSLANEVRRRSGLQLTSVQFICVAHFHKLQMCLGGLYNQYI